MRRLPLLPFQFALATSLISAFGALLSCARAAEQEAFTDPAKAGPDYAVQGEYAGNLQWNGAPTKIGAQVIALGDGKFDAVLYSGGLPGDGWKRGDFREKAGGKTEGDATNFKSEKWTAKLAGGALSVIGSGGDSLGSLAKVERKSPTLGEKPPAGATVLFDGANADQFKNGKIVEGDLLLAGTFTKDKFTDFMLHIEFRTPFVPAARGQARGNSGVYLQNRYEVQVLDSFGLEGADNECGGIYKIATPLVNMCLPPLTWQTYDVKITAARYEGDKRVKDARVTIKHNGVVIQDDLELPHATPGGQGEGPDPAPLQLQQHGNPVTYRNIWIVPSN
jgi:hypothetical protein